MESMERLVEVVGITAGLRVVALTALHEATGEVSTGVSAGRVAQLRRMVDRLHVEVRRLEEAMDEEDAPIVRKDDPAVSPSSVKFWFELEPRVLSQM